MPTATVPPPVTTHDPHGHSHDERVNCCAEKYGPRKADDHGHDHGSATLELVAAAIAGIATAGGWALETFVPGVPQAVAVGVFAVAYLAGGWFPVQDAWQAIRSRRFDVDVLMVAAAFGAALLGEYREGALLLFMFTLAHGLEHHAMGRARRAVEALADLAPDTARRRASDGTETVVSVNDLAVGDVVVVRPHERLPADGFVQSGESAVNQAPVTGESVPVDKRPVADVASALADPARLDAEHRVFAGSLNGSGSLDVVVTRLASQSTLARVAQLVAEAETGRSPTQQFAARVERVFVPVVLAFVFVLLFAWVVIDEPWQTSFYRAMAVLVGASPCALAIATPSAVLAGVARAGRGGVLVKGGAALEALGSVSVIAFDKTGTLTEGRPQLTDVRPVPGVDETDLLEAAVAVEREIDHPIARGVVASGIERLGREPSQRAEAVEALTGKGLRGRLGGDVVYVGKPDHAALPDTVRRDVAELESAGRTTFIVQRGERYLGALGVMDPPRATAAAVVQRLRGLGVEEMVMLSGDRQGVADAVAQSVGLDGARGDLMPEDKVAAVRSLAQNGRGVAMVGDGVNDAPALAAATVGIAMGAAGSDVALETADVALMADDLSTLPFAVGLSRRAARTIRQNVWLSLAMVAFLIPAALFGLRMGPAVVLHEGSTLVVVFNALRLLAYRAEAYHHAQEQE